MDPLLRDHAAMVRWMIKAADRGFLVELVVVGVENNQLLLDRRARRQGDKKLMEAVRRVSSAVDSASRVVAIGWILAGHRHAAVPIEICMEMARIV